MECQARRASRCFVQREAGGIVVCELSQEPRTLVHPGFKAGEREGDIDMSTPTRQANESAPVLPREEASSAGARAMSHRIECRVQ